MRQPLLEALTYATLGPAVLISIVGGYATVGRLLAYAGFDAVMDIVVTIILVFHLKNLFLLSCIPVRELPIIFPWMLGLFSAHTLLASEQQLGLRASRGAL